MNTSRKTEPTTSEESDNPIDRFHEYTHTEAFVKDMSNQAFRAVIGRLAELTQWMKNSSSAQHKQGFMPDFIEVKRQLDLLNTVIQLMIKGK